MPIVPAMADAAGFFAQLAALEEEGAAFVLVLLVEATGSTPQDTGARMIVTPAGRLAGTVGGGRVEARAIDFARDLLAAAARGPVATRLMHWSLKGDVGMTCGGSVSLYFEPHAARGTAWPIVIFGAGHVAQALVPVLQPLPCSITVCDARPEWIERIPRARNVRVIVHEKPAALVSELPGHAFVLCMTQGHGTVRTILQRALTERSFPFLGVIGSDAKAAVLRRELTAAGVSAARAAEFFCPVGLPFGSNHPHEIALSIAAQLLQERDRRAHGPQGK
jgi:xanthine dehydrogenase accessory factor